MRTSYWSGKSFRSDMRLMLLFIALSSFVATAQDVPKLKLERYYLDLGQVKINSSKQWKVNVKNEGNAKLRISEVDPNCSCVKVSSFPEELLPKEAGEFKGYVKSGTKGDVMKFVSIRSNDNSGEQKLSIRINFI